MPHDIVPETYGARGDGATDDTDALNRALAATREGTRLCLANRAYAVSTLAVGPGMGGIVGPGRLINRGAVEAVVGVRGVPGQAVRGATLADLEIETHAAHVGIVLRDAVECRLERCRVSALQDGHVGIQLQGGCVGNHVRNNRIAADLAKGSLVCVEVISPGVDRSTANAPPPDGRVDTAPETTHSNLIEGNHITDGTHGVLMSGTSRNRIAGNTISGSTHRNILLCPASRYNRVEGNLLLDAGSSAVALGYGSSFNVIAQNTVRSFATVAGWDRDALHAYVGCGHNVIAGNQVTGDFRYGVYLAADAVANVVQGNVITLSKKPELADDFTVGVAIENDWPERPLPPGALYSRQNFGSRLPLAWAYGDSAYNLVQHNALHACTCGIYLAQIGAKLGLDYNRIINNTLGPAFTHALYVHGETEGRMTGNIVFGLWFSPPTETAVVLPAWKRRAVRVLTPFGSMCEPPGNDDGE